MATAGNSRGIQRTVSDRHFSRTEVARVARHNPLVHIVATIMILFCFVGNLDATVHISSHDHQHHNHHHHHHHHQRSYHPSDDDPGYQGSPPQNDDGHSTSELIEASRQTSQASDGVDAVPKDEDKDRLCANDRLKYCLSLLQTLSTDHNLAFAANVSQLDEMCTTMRSGLYCVNKHVSKCFGRDHRRRIKQLLLGTDKTVQLLCTEGPLRQRYLEHASCMRDVSTDTALCGQHYNDLITSVELRDNLSSHDTIRLQCCSFHTYLACMSVAAAKRCGEDTGQFVEEYSYKTAGPIILTRCRGYVPGSDMCSASDGHVTAILFYKTLMAVLLLILHGKSF